MTGTRTTPPTTSAPPIARDDERWTAHPFAILVAAVALSLAAALFVARGDSTVVAAPADSGQPAADAEPAVAAEPATAGSIIRPASDVAAPIGSRGPATVDVELETSEVDGQLADGTVYRYWTFNGQVPGPMIRVRVGDTVNLTLSNAADSQNVHSIDLHAVTGPGGGAKALQVPPGESKSITFKALNPGVFIYHCASPHIPTHIANGMYGLIVVEPEGGLAPVDEEFYLVQGEIYTTSDRGTQGVVDYDFDEMVSEQPDYVVFNGAVNALTGDHAMHAQVGDRVRLFVGNGGPNKISSFHVIGEIMDAVHTQGAAEADHNIQTTLIPAGGAMWAEFTTQVPGDYVLLDHAISRAIDKGGLAILTVSGDEHPEIFEAHDAEAAPGDEAPGDDGAQAASYAPGDTIDVSMTEFSFGLQELELAAGEYTFHVVNDGVAPHQFAIGAPGSGEGDVTDLGLLNAGESDDVTVELAAGSYEIGCHIPGHYESGMRTSLVVT